MNVAERTMQAGDAIGIDHATHAERLTITATTAAQILWFDLP